MARYLSIPLVVTLASCGGDAPGGADVIVDPPASTIASVSVQPGSLSLTPGGTSALAATARDSRGATVNGTTFTWTTSAPAVATVSTDGTVTAVEGGVATITASAGRYSASASVNVEFVYDITTRGVPKIVVADYIEVGAISRVSRFRSGIGHDQSDDVERCRSMKHYFQPRSGMDWGSITISSPIAGTIADARAETTFGTQLRITSNVNPAFSVILYHVKPDAGMVAGTTLAAGQRIGTHIGSQTMSDIAVRVSAKEGMRYVSYFDAMADAVFEPYAARGVASRAAMAITAAERDASPLSCTGETFADAGTLSNWVVLQ